MSNKTSQLSVSYEKSSETRADVQARRYTIYNSVSNLGVALAPILSNNSTTPEASTKLQPVDQEFIRQQGEALVNGAIANQNATNQHLQSAQAQVEQAYNEVTNG